jgi:hypothetical protein
MILAGLKALRYAHAAIIPISSEDRSRGFSAICRSRNPLWYDRACLRTRRVRPDGERGVVVDGTIVDPFTDGRKRLSRGYAMP